MDDKVRVYEVAEEAGASSNEVISKAAELGIDLKSPQSTLTFDQAEEIVNFMVTGKSDKIKPKPVKKVSKKPVSETKTEEKIDPVKEVIKQAEAKKEEKEKLKASSENEIKKAPEKSLSEGEAPLKRRKLTIVKKKRPQEEVFVPATIEPKKQAMKSMSELFGNNEISSGEDNSSTNIYNKPKKAVKKVPARAADHGKKLDLDTVVDFTNRDTEDSLMGEEVVLYDMDMIETSKFLQETPKKQDNIRTTKPSAFGNVPRGLKRSSKKKKYIKKVEEAEITSVTIPEECRVYEFAEKIGKSAGDVIGKLFMLGMMVTKNDFLGNDEIEILGEEYGIEITIKDELEEVNYEEAYRIPN